MGLWEAFKCQNKCYLTRAEQFSRVAQAANLQSAPRLVLVGFVPCGSHNSQARRICSSNIKPTA